MVDEDDDEEEEEKDEDDSDDDSVVSLVVDNVLRFLLRLTCLLTLEPLTVELLFELGKLRLVLAIFVLDCFLLNFFIAFSSALFTDVFRLKFDEEIFFEPFLLAEALMKLELASSLVVFLAEEFLV